jgi:cathepsin A (carboxypeptidase C)
MALRAALSASLLYTGTAQLVANSLEELKALAASQLGAEESGEVADGFVNPTICDSSVKQTAGFLEANGETKYFFWLFESKSDPAKDPLIMWLSGGPGCSSQLALLAENGPCLTKGDSATPVANPDSWHNKANVMWLDQPAGVGFSTGLGTSVHDEVGVSNNMHTFLQNFFKALPQYQKNDFFIFGESYAGHYVPAIGHKIWESNKKQEGVTIPMKGIAIGNGLTNPKEQYKWYAEMGYTGGKSEGGHAPGVFSDDVYQTMKEKTPQCIAKAEACEASVEGANSQACVDASTFCNDMVQTPYQATGKNPYDQRIPCETGNLCYDFSGAESFLNSAEVQTALGVNKKWQSCNYAVNFAFQAAGDWMRPYEQMIPDLLHDGLEVLVYAGDCDYICNWLGNKAWTRGLEWDGAADFNQTDDKDWQLNGETVARLRSFKNFHFMQVFAAGHMVPMDQPAVSLEMVNQFVAGKMNENTISKVVV